MKLKKIIKILESKGYKITDKFVRENAIRLEGNGIVIILCGKRTLWRKVLNWSKYQVYENEIRAETLKTFNKWSQAYYQRKLPKTKNEMDIILNHLEMIKTEHHIERANEFEYFFDNKEG